VIYVAIFFGEHGQLNITDSSGLFLWSRTMSFANCSIIKPPASLAPLCPENQPDHPTASAPAWSIPALLGERTPADYLWNAGAWYRVDAHPGINAYNNKLATRFAERAILAQPAAYLKTVGKEVLETFFTTDRRTDYLAMQFTVTPHVNPEVAYMAYWEHRYAYTTANTHLHQPWAYLMFLYQEPVWFPGVVFFGVMVGGLVLLIRRWRGFGRFAFLGSGWTVGLANEAALKLREASGAWAEAYPAMEYRHGPISANAEETLVWPVGKVDPGVLEDAARAGSAIAANGTSPLASLVLAQRVAVALARARNLDPDHPHSLTRSVVLP